MHYTLTPRVCDPVVCIESDLTNILRLRDALADNMGAVGLAAPQIGWDKRVFATRFSDGIFINPTITSQSKMQNISVEGCLSYPNEPNIEVPRTYSVTIRYLNLEGVELTRTYRGYEATVIQHEMDHLNGKSIYDYRYHYPTNRD